ncbi:MAG: sigma-E factor negative regulatory protein [Halioglobus sp.]|nr:sigma-E factor negative regulatory protein [Halioglobus sp.]
MSEKLRESLSALMDGEADELELQRVLASIDGDRNLRRAWSRYNAARAVMTGHAIGALELDISEKVSDAIRQQPLAEATAGGPGQRLLRPLASFAIAASVAVVVVLGGRQLAVVNSPGTLAEPVSVAARPSPVGVLNSLGATPVRASYGTQSLPGLQPATRSAYDELARQRMSRYMQQHAEHASLNSPQGLIPFARVTELRE